MDGPSAITSQAATPLPPPLPSTYVAPSGGGRWAARHLQAAARLATFPGALDVEGAAAVLQLPTHEAASLLAELHNSGLVRVHATPTAALQETAALGRGQEPGLQAEAESRFVSHTLRRLGEWAAAYQTAGGWRDALASAREQLADIERLLELLGSVGEDISGSVGGSEGGGGGGSSGDRGADLSAAAAAAGDCHGGPSAKLDTVARMAACLTDEVYQLLCALGLSARLEQPYASLLRRLDAAAEASSSTSVQLGTAAVLGCLGLQRMRAKGRYQGTKDLQRSHELYARCLGPQHPDTLRSLVALADSVWEYDHHAEAQECLQKALKRQQRVLGEQHPDAMRTVCLLASWHASAGQHEEAEKLTRRALQLLQDALGEEHPDSAKALLVLGRVLGKQGKHAEGLAACERALELQRDALGEGSEDAISTLEAVSGCLSRMDRHADAEAAAREAYTLASGALGDHETTCQALWRLSDSCRQQGRLNEQEQHLRCLLQLQRRLYGPEDVHVALTLRSIARSLILQGERLCEAEQLCREALALLQREYGEKHVRFAGGPSVFLLARVFIKQKRWLEGAAVCRSALRTLLRLLGPDHADTQEGARLLSLCMRRAVKVWSKW